MQPRQRAGLMACVVVAIAAASCGRTVAEPSSETSTPATPDQSARGCAVTSVGLTPLTDLASGSYQGQIGGLYPGGSNARPGLHDAAGIGIARDIHPLDANGAAHPAGRYALISIGMSNTTQEFSVFKPLADGDPSKDPRLAIVDGAQGGMTATDWADPGCSCWTVLAQRVATAGLAPGQVAVAWIKLAERQPSQGWPTATQILKNNIVTVMQLLKQRFPNLQLAYLSSRIYAGYATSTLNPEPYAYQSAFAVRWVIEDQLTGGLSFDPRRGQVAAPWLSWGPYLWADGLKGRSDGLTWACSDLQSDGTHPSATGARKVADLLLNFFRTDATAREWYLASP